MKITELVDIDKLSERLAAQGNSAFHYWTETALEVCRDKYRDILNIRTIYQEIPDAELSPLKFDSFVRALVDIMPTLEQKKTLLRTEALPEIIFEKRP